MNKQDLNARGRIFNIQRYSIHDGPGIRTIIFLKGCPLRCRWCCNPESQSAAVQQMAAEGKTETVGRDVTAEEILEEIKKDMPYYRRSGGGVTLSGGEALLQPEFAVPLLRLCRENGINTAIETTGFALFEQIENYLPYLNYVLMDIKHMNARKHEEFTGQSNRLILQNARRIAQTGADLTIRVPVIPTFNDTEQEIRDIAVFAAELPNVKCLHLLPYHRLGEGKYAGLGREYTMRHIVPMDRDRLMALLNAAKQSGLDCRIGG